MISLYKQDGETLYGTKEFLLDSVEDLTDIPIAKLRPGSSALIIPTGELYIFSGNKEWQVLGGKTKADKNELVQADWNQNDETAPDYIKNRPFWTSDQETIIVEETTFEIVNGFGDLVSTRPLKVGQEYVVNLDGTAYNCVGKFNQEFSTVYIGNSAFIEGEDTGEPFFIAPEQSETELGIMINSDVVEHNTVKIVGMIAEVHKIDKKYLPDDIEQVQSDWNQTDENKLDYIKNRPFGTRIGKKYLIEPQTIVFDSKGRGYGEHIDGCWEYIFIGTLCEIEFDGEIYTCITEYQAADDSYLHRFTTLSGIDVDIWNLRDFVAPGLSGEHTISLNVEAEVIDLIDEKFIPDSIVSMKMDSYNPSGEGKFSMNRQENSMEGVCSTTFGTGNIASSVSQHVIGEYNSVSSDEFTIGITQREETDPEKYGASETIYVSDKYTFDGTTRKFTLIDPITITAAEYSTIFTHTGAAKRFISRTITSKSIVAGYSRYKYWTDFNSLYLYAPIIYSGVIQCSNRGKYVHIIGNGTSDTQRSNAHTVDWNGNAWYAGDVYIGGSGQDDEKANKLQKELDNSLDTEAKTIVDAINEVNAKANATTKPLIVTDIGGNTSSLSAKEIYNAKNNGQTVIFKDGDYIYQLVYAEVEPSAYAEFSSTNKDVNYFIIINHGNTITRNVNVIGNSDELTTTSKEIVGAINEVNAKANESDEFVVNVAWSYPDDYTADKTFSDIQNAYKQNKDVIARYEHHLYSLMCIHDHIISFTNFSPLFGEEEGSYGINCEELQFNEDGEIRHFSYLVWDKKSEINELFTKIESLESEIAALKGSTE